MYIYCLPIYNLLFTYSDSSLLRFVSFQRQNRILRCHSQINKKLSLYSALLIRKIVSERSGMPAKELLFSCEANHKPKLLHPAHYKFSLSHTHNFILCCVSEKGEVGADAERIQTPLFEIMDQVFHKEEISHITSSVNPSHSFYEIWTKKEAYTKFLGTGLTADLTHINTLSIQLSHGFFNWQESNYMCSVYSQEPPLDANRIHVSESDILNFYDS